MLYGDRSVKGDSTERKEAVAQDLEYLQGMYPIHMKRLQEYVISACDHLDYRNSPMYDEFPDRILINQVCDSICAQIRKDGIITDEQPAGTDSSVDTSEKEDMEKMDWEEDEAASSGMCGQQRYSTWGPPDSWPPDDPRWGPPPDRRRPGRRPPGGGPPGWGPPGPPWWDSSANNGWLSGVISVLLLNEMHRRRCRNDRCW